MYYCIKNIKRVRLRTYKMMKDKQVLLGNLYITLHIVFQIKINSHYFERFRL